MEQVSANIGISGALISAQTVENFRRPNVKHAQLEPAAFCEPGMEVRKPAEISGDMAAAFELLCEQWDSVRKAVQPGGEIWDDVSMARRRWILPVLEALGYQPQFQQARVAVDEAGKLRFNISHRAWEGVGAPYVHTVAPGQDLDQRAAGRGSLAPHDELQRYLNATSAQKWGLVTNGRRLRILRDFHHTSVRGYIEFDLDGIFETRDRADFRALYRLAHVSRLVEGEDGKTPLEHLYDESTAAGVAIGGKLRQNVRTAIEELANGFLRGHPETIEALQAEPEHAPKAFYEEVLQVVYRMLFLLFAEQRGLLPGRTQLYQESYSISALRARAERPFRSDDPHCDLWEGLKVTFGLMRDGNDALGVPKLGGELFGRGTDRFVDGMRCPNGVLLATIRDLALVERDKVLQRVSYVDLGVDELGSIYEALLDYQPRIAQTTEEVPLDPDGKATRTVRTGQFFLDPRGMSRKSSGTYYTNPQLVDRLIQSALVPVMEERLDEAGDATAAQEAALLDIKVVDPACGSGAFLIAATNTLGLRLGRVRTGEDYPPTDEVDRARHDVLAHCIYGVDLNPTTVTLAKVSLWIAAAAKGEPLTFLDHRIRCGNSLIGATPELLEAGVPDEAFTPVTGDDKDVAKEAMRKNREERKAWAKGRGGVQPGLRVTLIEDQVDLDCYLRVAQMAADDPEEARQIYESCRASPAAWSAQQVADTWTAAFFWPLDGSEPPPTEGVYRALLRRELGLPNRAADAVRGLAEEYRFFHWHLEFPEVFNRQDPGFDVVLGNPPWEQLEQTTEDPTSRRAVSTLERFSSCSGAFPLCAASRKNLYALFVERAWNSLLRTTGRIGMVVPTGLVTDKPVAALVEALFRSRSLASLYDFENRGRWFPGVHRQQRFCLCTVAAKSSAACLCFDIEDLSDIEDPQRAYSQTYEEILSLCDMQFKVPLFRGRSDEAIASASHKRAATVGALSRGPDPLLHSGLIFNFEPDVCDHKRTAEECRDQVGECVCVYEGEYIHQFDHRYATYDVDRVRDVTDAEHRRPDWEIATRHYLPVDTLKTRLRDVAGYDPQWILVLRRQARASDAVTAISAVVPSAAVEGSLSAFFPVAQHGLVTAAICANLNSFIFNFLLRLRQSGANVNKGVYEQIPLIATTDLLESVAPWGGSETTGSWIGRRVVELCYTSSTLRAFAVACGVEHDPYPWNEVRRVRVRAELEAAFFLLYGLGRDQIEHIMNSFPIVRHQERQRFGTYRSLGLILEAYDGLVHSLPLPGDAQPAASQQS